MSEPDPLFLKLRELLELSLDKFYKNDSTLLKNGNGGVCERCMVFRIGIYMQCFMAQDSSFNCYFLDSEYNRNFGERKIIPECENGTYPDLIIHKRLSHDDDCHLLYMEFKKKNSSEQDEHKLKEFTASKGGYGYKYGFYITHLSKNKVSIAVYIDGKNEKTMKWKYLPKNIC